MIRLQNVTKSYGSKTILKNVSLMFPENQRIAIVGPNGAGKTTLLKMICGLETWEQGEILKNQKTIIGYLPQEPNPFPAATVLQECMQGATRIMDLKLRMDSKEQELHDNYSPQIQDQFENLESDFRAAGGLALQSRCKGILNGLGFDHQRFDISPTELSGGWRMRLELAKIFVNDPDYLILDEPTNHLDLPSLAWVERYLQNFPGTLIFVSHDKALLNRLANVIVHLQGSKIAMYKGNFDSFLEQHELQKEQQAHERENINRRRVQLQSFVERFGAKASKASQAASRVKMLERLNRLEAGHSQEENLESLYFHIPLGFPSGKEVLRIQDAQIGYSPDKPLFSHLDLEIFRNQKIAIIGANGIGKSTTLKTIVGKINALSGKLNFGHNVSLGYFAQDQLDSLDPNKTVLQNVLLASSHTTEKQARNLLGSFLFHGEDVYKKVHVLSGGEKSRVGLAKLICEQTNFLILDEPTNHLDMSSCEILANAIAEFEGTVLYVSHDRSFINSTCTHVFCMLADGRSALFEGNLEDYERLTEVAGLPNILSPDKPALSGGKSTKSQAVKNNKNNVEQQNNLKKEKLKLERLIKEAEIKIEILSAEKRNLEEKMIEHSSSYDHLKKLQQDFKETCMKLEEAESKWSEFVESLSNT